MTDVFKPPRGPEATMPTLEDGAVALTTDTHKWFMGTTSGNVAISLPENSQGVIAADQLPTGSADIDNTLAEGDLLYHHVVTSATIGFIGDSITILTPTGGNPPPTNTAADLTSGGLTVSVNNQALSGTTSTEWTPTAGTGYYAAAKAAFIAAGVKIVHIMLGTNDSRDSIATSEATYESNVAAICADLNASGMIAVLSYPPYVVPGSGSGDYTITSDTRLQSYQTAIDQIVNGYGIRQGDVNAYTYFSSHTSELVDGVHPTATGSVDLGQFWANALKPIVTAPLARLPLGANHTVLQSNGTDPAYALITDANIDGAAAIALSKLAQSGATTGQVLEWNGTAWVPATISTTGGNGGTDHLHGLARWVGDGSTTAFALPDIPEYLEMVYDNGNAVDVATISLSSDLTQIVLATAPAAGHVLQAEYVIARI